MTIEALAKAAQRHGTEAVALTDHGRGADFDAAELVLRAHGVALVPGREVSCALGHVLVLGTDRTWLSALPPRIDLPPTGSRGPVALVWAHPAGWRVGGAMIPPDPTRGAEHLHGLEVLNGERLYQADGVEHARTLAAGLGLPECGGSDAHDPASVGRCLTEARAAADALSFIEALVAGEVRPVLSERWGATNQTVYSRADLVGFLG